MYTMHPSCSFTKLLILLWLIRSPLSAMPSPRVWTIPKTMVGCSTTISCCRKSVFHFYVQYGYRYSTYALLPVQSFRSRRWPGTQYITFQCQETRQLSELVPPDHVLHRGPFVLHCPIGWEIAIRREVNRSPVQPRTATVKVGACQRPTRSAKIEIHPQESSCAREIPQRVTTIDFFAGWTTPLADQLKAERERQRQHEHPLRVWITLRDTVTGGLIAEQDTSIIIKNSGNNSASRARQYMLCAYTDVAPVVLHFA